eukprot:6035363-Pyramimonas_sp.AAC.3
MHDGVAARCQAYPSHPPAPAIGCPGHDSGAVRGEGDAGARGDGGGDEINANRVRSTMLTGEKEKVDVHGEGGIEVQVRQWDLFDQQQREQTDADLVWSLAAFVTVFAVVWLVTGSFWVALGGMTGIILSFPVTKNDIKVFSNDERIVLIKSRRQRTLTKKH